jgi:hypothetical protein
MTVRRLRTRVLLAAGVRRVDATLMNAIVEAVGDTCGATPPSYQRPAGGAAVEPMTSTPYGARRRKPTAELAADGVVGAGDRAAPPGTATAVPPWPRPYRRQARRRSSDERDPCAVRTTPDSVLAERS